MAAWKTAFLLIGVLVAGPAHGQGLLDLLREDVRAPAGDAAPSPQRPAHCHDDHHDHDPHDEEAGAIWGWFGLLALTSPIWGPHAALGDDFSNEAYFPRYPYDADAPGHMVRYMYAGRVRRWSARLTADYATDFDDLDRLGGSLLLSTTSRWGLDTEMSYFEERLPGARRDRLWLGDCNIVFRFAQCERMEWRVGVGFNWLDDPVDTDFGFNFTYGVDFFPRKPWVLSAALDWGTLGRAELFHFRTTAGVLIRGAEAFTGYEYYDIDRARSNQLIAGVRLWF